MKEGVDFIGVGIGAVIINRDRKFFLAQRGPKTRNERGKWETPGGGVRFGETMSRAVIREMREEYNIKVEILEQLLAKDHIILDEHQHWVAVSYLCRLISGEPTILEKHKCSQIGWFTLDEAEALPLTIATVPDVAELKRRYSKGLPNLY